MIPEYGEPFDSTDNQILQDHKILHAWWSTIDKTHKNLKDHKTGKTINKERVISIHKRIVKEMIKRGFKHNYASELDDTLSDSLQHKLAHNIIRAGFNPCDDWTKKLNLQSVNKGDFPKDQLSKYYLSEKIDGELNAVLYKRDKYCYLVTRNGKIREDLYMLDEYRRILDAEESIDEIIIMGEGAATRDGNILPFNESESILKTAYRNKSNDKLYHHYPFDIFSMNGKSDNMAWSTKMRTLIGLFETSSYIHPVHYVAHDLEKSWTSLVNRKGIEGVVGRNDSGKNFKIKKSFTFDLVIIAVGNDNHDAWKNGKAAYVRCAFVDSKGNYIMTSKVDGFSNKLKLELFTWATGHTVNQTRNERWVDPLKIIECKWMNIYKKSCPVYKYRSDGYGIVGNEMACTMMQPSLIRFRSDKKVDESDLGIRQIP